jgi:chromosome segregation ATPase
MKKTAILTTMLAMLIVTFCLNGYADDLSSQIAALEQKAGRIQNQINQATQQNDLAVDQQVKSLMASVDSLVKQRVQLDSYIAKLESQIDDLKKNAQVDLNRQIKSYSEELGTIKQQISGLVAKKSAQMSQPTANPDSSPTQAATTPAPAGN